MIDYRVSHGLDETHQRTPSKGRSAAILHDSVIHSTNGASYDSHREAGKKEEALKGLRKGRIPYAAVAREDTQTHNLEFDGAQSFS